MATNNAVNSSTSPNYVSLTDTQTANRILAGPTTGGAAAPTFRALVAADLPITYATSTFTPTLIPSSGSFTSVTYAVQVGKYTQIGNFVWCEIYVTTTAITVGTASGTLAVGTLPVAQEGGSSAIGSGNLLLQNVTFSGVPVPQVGLVNSTSVSILNSVSGASVGSVQVSDLATGSTVIIRGGFGYYAS